MTFEELQSTLLSTVWGVVLLGAIGSVLGGFLVYFAKKIIFSCANKLKSNFPKTRLFYPIYRSAILGHSIKELKVKEHENADYILFAIRASIMSAMDIVLSFFLMFLTAIVSIFFGLDRPILLTLLLSLTILSVFAWLKSGTYSLSLILGETYKAEKELNKAIPKKYEKGKVG